MAIASVTNILLDCIAVFELGWGMEGAAAATVAAQVVSVVICLIRMGKMQILHISKTDLRPDKKLQGILLGLSMPIAMQNVIIAVGGMAMQTVVNRFGTEFIAGYTATNKLFGLLEMAAMAYGYGMTTYAGQNFGAQLWQRIRSGVRWAAVISILTAVVISAAMILFGRQITGLFLSTESPELAAAAGDIAYYYLFIMSALLPVLYLLHVYRSALQGMGNTKIPLISGIVEFTIRVGMSVLISYCSYQMVVFWAEPMAWFGATVLLMSAYFYQVSKLERTKENR
jgi:Na+-driven multidrug efflux pump